MTISLPALILDDDELIKMWSQASAV